MFWMRKIQNKKATTPTMKTIEITSMYLLNGLVDSRLCWHPLLQGEAFPVGSVVGRREICSSDSLKGDLKLKY